MLAALTATAVKRGWPPQVYVRLVDQLGDLSESSASDRASELINALTSNATAAPLEFEYLSALSGNPQSCVYFPDLLALFAGSDWHERPQNIKDLVSYLARAAPDMWSLSTDYPDIPGLRTAISKLLDQAIDGCEEIRLLLVSLTNTNIFDVLNDDGGVFKQSTESRLQQCFTRSVLSPKMQHKKEDLTRENLSQTEPASDTARDAPQHPLRSSRAMRFLWLDWALRTAQELDDEAIKRYLNLMWPGDRVPVVSYELCVTAFDVLAAPSSLPYAPRVPALARAFVVKRLPLVLQRLLKDENDANQPATNLDGVVARLFTTMDKEVVASVEQQWPGIRAEFGTACVDIKLCDPTVLHALHRSYTAQPEPLIPEDISSFDISIFPQLYPGTQARIARDLADSARGSSEPMGQHRLASLCVAMYRDPSLCDELFVHIPFVEFVECVIVHANAAAEQHVEDDRSLYDDLGALLGFASTIASRYNVDLNKVLPQSWATQFLSSVSFPQLNQLSGQNQHLLGQWVVTLFSKSSGGIPDDILRPFTELAEVLPALLLQATKAYQCAVIDREVLRNGLEHFTNTNMAILIAPLVMRTLHTELLRTIHQSTTVLECAVFFLGMLVEKSVNNEMELAKSLVLPIAQKMSASLNLMQQQQNSQSSSAQKTSQIGSAEIKLASVLSALTKKLEDQQRERIPSLHKNPKAVLLDANVKPTSSLAEMARGATASLANWQLKPLGIPPVPTPIVCMSAKPVLGAKQTLKIVESACAHSTETMVAILVADGLQDVPSRLIDEAGESFVHAHKFLDQLQDINSWKSERRLGWLPVYVPEAKTRPTAEATTPAQTSASIDLPLMNSLTPSPMQGLKIGSPSSPVNFDMDMMMMDEEPVQNVNFGDDFAAQPMNLEDLDSAMDFGWD